MEAMIRLIVGVIDERIGTLDDLHLRVVLIQRSDMGIVLPQFGATRANISLEPARITAVEIPDRGRHHDDIARRKKTFENELSHRGKKRELWFRLTGIDPFSPRPTWQ